MFLATADKLDYVYIGVIFPNQSDFVFIDLRGVVLFC
jgi:hypothetical protein